MNIPKKFFEEYEVRENGDIISKERFTESGNQYKKYKIWIRKRLLKPHSDDKNPYPYIRYKGKAYKIHILVAEKFLPKTAGKDQINHKDGNKKNNHISNLEWVNAKENIRHAYNTGLIKPRKGEPRNKLSDCQVREIKNNIVMSCYAMAKVMGVNFNTISKIRTGKRRKNIK